jgi:hypothetical protein
MTEPQRKRVCRSDGEGGLNLWSGARYRASKPALISAEFGLFFSRGGGRSPPGYRWGMGFNRCGGAARNRALSAAEIIKSIIRQNFSLKKPTSRREGVGGLNLRRVWASYRIGLHAHIFFLSAELLIQSKRIKQIKRAVNAGVLRARDDEGPENWGFIFRAPRQPFSGDWKSAAKFRVGGGVAGWATS